MASRFRWSRSARIGAVTIAIVVLSSVAVGWTSYSHPLRAYVPSAAVALLSGAILLAVILASRVTRRLRAVSEGARRELSDNSRFLTSIIDKVPTMVFVKDAQELRFVRFNRAAEAISGYSEEDLLGKNDFDLFPDKEARFFTASDRAVLKADGVVVIGDEVITRADGAQRILYTKKVALRDENSAARYLLGISEDVTERRQVERELENREKRFRAIVEAAANGVITIDDGGAVTALNRAASLMFGLDDNDVVGRHIGTLIPELDPQRRGADPLHEMARDNKTIAGGGSEQSGLRANGSVFPLWLSVATLAADDHSAFAAIVRDLSREKEDERRLIEARRLAEKANRAKSEFLATMSHELRTPLNAIIGYSEMLAEEATCDGAEGPAARDLEKIRAAGRHLLMLINDILDLSKIEARRIDVDVTQFSADDLIREVTETVRALVEKNGNGFEVSVEDSIGHVQTDPTRVRQIVMNLLSNAAKFTSGGKVRLSAGLETDPADGSQQLVIEVSDTGIGIEPEQLDRVFEAFAQADKTTSREYGGTGLGLAITRGSCELLGGTVSVSSEPGNGSVFTVRLPVVIPDSTAVSVTGTFPAPADQLKLPGSNTVLLIEDDASARGLLVSHLQAEGWQVAEASTGSEGLKLAQELRPCAIVLDVIMPELDGWTVLKILKNDAELSRIPVVLCTIVDDKNQGFALGAADYLIKPVSRNELVETLSRYYLNPSCHLLVVEDDAPTRELYARAAERHGWSVMQAGDGARALQYIAERTPDLILLDLMMPEVDGFDVIAALQREPDWRHIPVVVVTAKELTVADRNRLNGHVHAVVSKSGRNLDELMSYVVDNLADIRRDLQ